MADTPDFLDVLQADVCAVLKNVPSLSSASIISDDEGDLDAKCIRALESRRNNSSGKRGLVIVVLRPEITDAEKNLPGPPLNVSIMIQTIEHVMFNRDPVNGANLTSSQAAVNVLSALHLRSFGSRILFADKSPIKSLPVTQGHLSRQVTLYTTSQGVVSPRAPNVSAAMESSLALSGVENTAGGDWMNGEFAATSARNGKPAWQRYKTPTQRAVIESIDGSDQYQISEETYAGSWTSNHVPFVADTAGNPWEVSWFADGNYTGTATVAESSQLVLTAGGNEASIYFTLDGTFPDSAVNAGDYTPGVLAPGTYSYFTTGPVSGLPAGTAVRAAVWLEDLGFGDVLELVVTA